MEARQNIRQTVQTVCYERLLPRSPKGHCSLGTAMITPTGRAISATPQTSKHGALAYSHKEAHLQKNRIFILWDKFGTVDLFALKNVSGENMHTSKPRGQ